MDKANMGQSDHYHDWEPYFGGCPTCHKNDGYLNIGRSHWMVCDTHRVKYCIGENLFSGWREESEEDWTRNAEILKEYTEVVFHSFCTMCGARDDEVPLHEGETSIVDDEDAPF